MSEQKKRRPRVPAKRRYKARVIAQPIPTIPMTAAPVNLTPTVPTPTVATTSTQMPMTKSAAKSILVMVYNLAKGKFDGVPYASERPQAEENPSVHNSNPPQLENIPNGLTFQVREDTPWPKTESASTNLFKTRADWPIPPTPAPTNNRSATPNSSDPPCKGFAQTNWRKMYMGTVLPHLHKGRGRKHRGLEWEQAERSTKKPPSTTPTSPPIL